MRKEYREKLSIEKIRELDKYSNDYRREHYHRLSLAIPKADKEKYSACAKQQGLSLTKFFLMTADDWIERNGE